VSGYYLSHPEARYFVLGPILEDQLTDYADRKGMDVGAVRRLLPANLYER
jgi:5-methyltetrahydrofolate--homocysteine methyltransferase